MSTGPTENEPQGQDLQGHPAWQSILDKLPEDLRPLIVPELEAWDKGVQAKVQGLHSQYDPYKEFAENQIDAETLKQSLYIANHLQSDPEGFVRRAIENFGLDILNPNNEQDNDDMLKWDGEDITKHPQFQALATQLEAINQWKQQQDQQVEQTQQEKQLEDYLDGLQEQNKDKGEFDRLYVSALMANGLKGEDAVNQFYETVNGYASKLLPGNQQQQQTQQQTQQPPVVMGGAGNAGSGSPNNPVNMGSLKNGEVSDLVIEMLKKMQT